MLGGANAVANHCIDVDTLLLRCFAILISCVLHSVRVALLFVGVKHSLSNDNREHSESVREKPGGYVFLVHVPVKISIVEDKVKCQHDDIGRQRYCERSRQCGEQC